MTLLKRLVQEEEGQGLVEYALIIAIISLVILLAGKSVGTAITNIFTKIAGELE